jgi:hypothetical protein
MRGRSASGSTRTTETAARQPAPAPHGPLPRQDPACCPFDLTRVPAQARGAAAPRWTVSSPSDPAEREADALAERALSPPVERAVAPTLTPGAGRDVIHRACAACDEEEERASAAQQTIQRSGEAAPSVTPRVVGAVAAMRGGGAPLPTAERRFFEDRFGYDLARVRIHDDDRAAGAARDLSAQAFTLRSDVAFAPGRYRPGSSSGLRLLAHELAHVIQQGEAPPLPGGGRLAVRSSAQDRIARREDDAQRPAAIAPAASVPASAPAPAESEAAGGLIVDDEAQTTTSGQARKTAFLAELRGAVCAAADRSLARVGRDTQGCPYIEKWLARYAARPASHLERAIRKLVPAARTAASAGAYIPLVAGRIAEGVDAWIETGRIPDEVREEMGEAGGGFVSALAAAGSAVKSAVGGAMAAVGGLFFKDGPGGARPGADPTALSARLGRGRPLEGATQARMESALGHSFRNVRIHDDAPAAGLSRDLNAHAFTLGNHVAFAQDSYRPGTLVGDALLAHELAHVVQQGGAPARMEAGASRAPAALGLERDADEAAAGAVMALWGKGRKGAGWKPRGRSGLSLQRCSKESAPAFGSVDAIVKNVKDCDGGTGVWAAATLGNGKKEPKVRAGNPAGGFRGDTDTTSGVITILKTLDACVATQTLVQELSNLSRAPDFTKIHQDAVKGDVSREDYIRGHERIEYETGVLNSIKAFDACSEKWGCAKGTVGTKEGFRAAKNFDDYLNNYLAQSHKDYYGKYWDENFKAAWKKKHP